MKSIYYQSQKSKSKIVKTTLWEYELHIRLM